MEPRHWMKTRPALWALAAVVALCAAAGRADAATDFALVTPQWVAAHSGDADVKVLDVRPDVKDYLQSHVPNAVYVSESAFRGPRGGVPVQYPSAQCVANVLDRCGLRAKDTVVVYSDGANAVGATMVAYILEKMGHPRVRIMDGGFAAYKATETTSQAFPSFKIGRVPARNVSGTHVSLDELLRLIGKPGVVLIDARPEEAYQGQTKLLQRNGHIPSAININWMSVMDPDNPHKFRPVEELRPLYSGKGVTPEMDIIVYCTSSREASLQYHVLKNLLDFPRVRLYEGSWIEYSSVDGLPVATGPERVALR